MAKLEIIEKKREEFRKAMDEHEKLLKASGYNNFVHNAVWDSDSILLKKLCALTELETLLTVEKKLDHLEDRGFEDIRVRFSGFLIGWRVNRLKRYVGID